MLIAQRKLNARNDRAARQISMGVARSKFNELRSLTKDRVSSGNVSSMLDLERQIKRTELYGDWLNHPVTKELALNMVSVIEQINSKLLDSSMDDKTRENLLQQRKEWRDMLSLFNPAKANDASLVARIDTLLEQFKKFYGTT